MDSNKIDELLNKYWNCETSLEEEKQLREYFRGNEIPEQLRETGALFQYFADKKKTSITDGSFDRVVLEKINKPKDGKVRKLVFNAMRIAAGVVVLVVATWFIRTEIRTNSPVEVTDTYDDPQIAFEETKKALLLISKSFGAAEEKAKKVSLFNEAQEQVQKEIETEKTKL